MLCEILIVDLLLIITKRSESHGLPPKTFNSIDKTFNFHFFCFRFFVCFFCFQISKIWCCASNASRIFFICIHKTRTPAIHFILTHLTTCNSFFIYFCLHIQCTYFTMKYTHTSHLAIIIISFRNLNLPQK